MDMKRSLMVLAAVFAMGSTSAVAGDVVERNTQTPASKAVQMTDEQLDEITAGAMTSVWVFNAGNAFVVPKEGKNHTTCVNCTAPVLDVEGTVVILGVINRAHPAHPIGDSILKCLGRCTF